eukprot:1173502-Pyramimonas_sp.AAC.1
MTPISDTRAALPPVPHLESRRGLRPIGGCARTWTTTPAISSALHGTQTSTRTTPPTRTASACPSHFLAPRSAPPATASGARWRPTQRR